MTIPTTVSHATIAAGHTRAWGLSFRRAQSLRRSSMSQTAVRFQQGAESRRGGSWAVYITNTVLSAGPPQILHQYGSRLCTSLRASCGGHQRCQRDPERERPERRMRQDDRAGEDARPNERRPLLRFHDVWPAGRSALWICRRLVIARAPGCSRERSGARTPIPPQPHPEPV
jgi:hypothetical protein